MIPRTISPQHNGLCSTLRNLCMTSYLFMDTKKCNLCDRRLPIENFAIKKSNKDGRQARCRKCHAEYTRKHYSQNKEYYIKKASRHDAKMRDLIRAHKEVPCTDCGVSYPWYVMDFDHLRDKEFNLCHAQKLSKNRVLDEIAKCEVVCSNCHRKRTYQRNISK